MPSSFPPPVELGDDRLCCPVVLPEQWGRAKGGCVCRLAGVQRVDEGGWNTVQGAKNSRVLDPTKFLKITKVGASIRPVQGNKNAEVLSYCICPSRKDRYGVYRSKLVFLGPF